MLAACDCWPWRLTSQPESTVLLQQLQHQASQCGEDGIRPSPVSGVFESEQLLEDELRQQLLERLKPLEDVPEEHKDWHPGSNQQVFAGLLSLYSLPLPIPVRWTLSIHIQKYSACGDIAILWSDASLHQLHRFHPKDTQPHAQLN